MKFVAKATKVRHAERGQATSSTKVIPLRLKRPYFRYDISLFLESKRFLSIVLTFDQVVVQWIEDGKREEVFRRSFRDV